MDQRHKQRKAEALKNLEEIERSIKDNENTEEETTTTKPSVLETEDTPSNEKEEPKMSETDDKYIVKIDFIDHADLLDLIKDLAKIEFRTVDQQILYMVNQQIVPIGEEIKP